MVYNLFIFYGKNKLNNSKLLIKHKKMEDNGRKRQNKDVEKVKNNNT